ncbi:hypothetical protein AB0N65_02125 [Paenarthrobacter sp. NPDC089322]|uniref:hypothetical protein n=1 Tax=Paenarthrobacter sp. NPDC089322 TaxID=3155065 RepID=UPI003414DEF2
MHGGAIARPVIADHGGPTTSDETSDGGSSGGVNAPCGAHALCDRDDDGCLP